MGNQQKEGVHYKLGELYAPVMKAAEVRLFMRVVAQSGLEVFKSNTKQAFLNSEKGEENIYPRSRLVARTSSGGALACPNNAHEKYALDHGS